MKMNNAKFRNVIFASNGGNTWERGVEQDKGESGERNVNNPRFA